MAWQLMPDKDKDRERGLWRSTTTDWTAAESIIAGFLNHVTDDMTVRLASSEEMECLDWD